MELCLESFKPVERLATGLARSRSLPRKCLGDQQQLVSYHAAMKYKERYGPEMMEQERGPCTPGKCLAMEVLNIKCQKVFQRVNFVVMYATMLELAMSRTARFSGG